MNRFFNWAQLYAADSGGVKRTLAVGIFNLFGSEELGHERSLERGGSTTISFITFIDTSYEPGVTLFSFDLRSVYRCNLRCKTQFAEQNLSDDNTSSDGDTWY